MNHLKLIILMCLTAGVFTFAAKAQDNSDVTNYKPPPLFGAKTQQKPVQTSKKKSELPKATTTIISPIDAPVPPKKPFQEHRTVPVPAPVANKTGNNLEPIHLRKLNIPAVKPPAKKPAIAKDIPNPVKVVPKKAAPQGIVKGPKTMPAVKKADVDAEILYEPIDQKPVGMIDRVQKKEDSKPIAKKEIAMTSGMNIPAFQTLEDGSERLQFNFSRKSITLDPGQKLALESLIGKLQENMNSKLQITAFASPEDGQLSADKRVSLSRALEIRQYLLDSDVEAQRIQVRAMGAQTTKTPLDRAEIHIITQ